MARQARVDVLLLQEANQRSLAALTEAAGLDWAVTAFDAGAPLPTNSGRDKITAILGRGRRPADIGYLQIRCRVVRANPGMRPGVAGSGHR